MWPPMRSIRRRALRYAHSSINDSQNRQAEETAQQEPGPGQSTAIALAHICKQLDNHRVALIIRWVPAHLNIPGNETADSLAKKATESNTLISGIISLSHIKAAARGARNCEWEATWIKEHAEFREYHNTYKRTPDDIFLTNNRILISTVTQLRSGHGHFNSYLTINPNNNVDSDQCHCPGRPPQTPGHLLLSCKLYRKERAVIDYTLSRTRHPKLKLAKLLHDKENYNNLTTFLDATQIATRRWRLGHFRERADPTPGDEPEAGGEA